MAPTHEEDITSLIASGLQSWRTLPVRVYQIGRTDVARTLTLGTKYRDEKRPRKGLLRAREFLMKDMYSFDMDENTAMKTYEEVRAAYDWFFGQIGLPFVTVYFPWCQLIHRWKQRVGILGAQYVTSITIFRKVKSSLNTAYGRWRGYFISVQILQLCQEF